MAESLEEREDQALYEIEHAIAEIIGPTEPGATGFYQMLGAQQHLSEYREAIERRVRAEERQRAAALHEARKFLPPDTSLWSVMWAEDDDAGVVFGPDGDEFVRFLDWWRPRTRVNAKQMAGAFLDLIRALDEWACKQKAAP